jgi:putative addiction module component (TIGR02574 family)
MISTLSESERAALAHELIMSLDGPRDESVKQAWNDEIVRRVAKVRSGKATLLSRDEFRTRMRESIGFTQYLYLYFIDHYNYQNRS